MLGKSARLRFAKKIADIWEIHCGSTNNAAQSAMDLHNNQIGRDIWNELSHYKNYIFGIGFNLQLPSYTALETKIFTKVESATFFPVDYDDSIDISNVANAINVYKKWVAVYIKRPNITFNIGNEITFERINSEFNIRVDLSDGNFNNQIIPRQYFIKSLDDLKIQIGDKLDAKMLYIGNQNIFNQGSNGYDGYEQISISYNGEAKVFEDLGNNEFLIGFTDNNGWSTRSTTQETNIQYWDIDSFKVSFSAKYKIIR
ncbi:hypothetical protein [uncultured Polaribacter sp.]|uniref:DUF6973 domain-containing protein n=1 Tax=uncultured Polaribacter sp. TaxID=174711 RepID=UPI002625DBEA|nr:hypothetical protein [uncultured Polaribacter sp.]